MKPTREEWASSIGRQSRDFYCEIVAPMRTMKLRTLQAPSALQTLLSSLVASQHWVTAESPQVLERSDLPSALQKVAIKASEGDGAWLAWTSYDGIRLFIAEMSLDLSRERGNPVLKVSNYNDEAQLLKYSVWVQLTDGSWRPTSY
jgi:hypothetical protein